MFEGVVDVGAETKTSITADLEAARCLGELHDLAASSRQLDQVEPVV